MPRTQRPRRVATLSQTILFVAIALIAHTSIVHAADCVQPADNAPNGVTFRATPVGSGTALGKLAASGTAPLIATIPRWYETRTPTGAVAFVSKSVTDLTTCPSGGNTTTTNTGGNGSNGGGGGHATALSFELHAIDVGTGLSILVRGPDFNLLYDAGSNDDLAIGDGNRVVAYLHTLTPSVSTIKHLLLSHPHRDHVELMPDVLAKFDVENVWNSGAYNDICGYRHFLEAVANEPGVAYHTATQGAGSESVVLEKKTCYGTEDAKHTITIPHQAQINDQPITLGQNASMTILHADGTQHSSFNENSLVVRLDLGSHRILLMGDAEAGGRKDPSATPDPDSIEGKLLACCRAELKADVMVVGHHGSKTSSRSALISAVGAKIFIISSGPTRYGSVVLPDDEVVSELQTAGDLFRTDNEDDQCAQNANKIGPDDDGKAGGCDNIVITIPATGPITGAIHQGSD